VDSVYAILALATITPTALVYVSIRGTRNSPKKTVERNLSIHLHDPDRGGAAMSQRVAIYARVSTLHSQNPEMQLAELREYHTHSEEEGLGMGEDPITLFSKAL
jgi:hypothetical protein